MRDLRYWLKDDAERGVVFDIGANAGHVSLAFQRYLKTHVYAFEPVRATHAMLKATVKGNRGIEAFQLAMGAEPGEALIAINADTSLVASMRPNAKYHGEASFEKVAVSTVDSFVSQHQVRHIAVIKIDVEGYEIEVLTGAANTLEAGIADFLVLETAFTVHPREAWVPLDRISAVLSPFGYEPWGVYDCERRRGDRGAITFMNVAFGRSERK